jgi:hypothetical protein
VRVKVGRSIRFSIGRSWLLAHPLSRHLLTVECQEWAAIGRPWRVIEAARIKPE